MVKHKKNQGKKNSKKIQKGKKENTNVLETSKKIYKIAKISTDTLNHLNDLASRHFGPMDNISNDDRKIYGIIARSRFLTGLTCLLTLFKWTMPTEAAWTLPSFTKMLRVTVGYNNEGKDLPEEVPMHHESRLTWYSIRRISELFLNCCTRGPLLGNENLRKLRNAHFKELYQVLEQDSNRSYLINVDYWSNGIYYQLWILYNGRYRVFLSLYGPCRELTIDMIDLPSVIDDEAAQRIDFEIRTKFLRGFPNLDSVDTKDVKLFGWLSAKYTAYYLSPRTMSEAKFQVKYNKMNTELDVVET